MSAPGRSTTRTRSPRATNTHFSSDLDRACVAAKFGRRQIPRDQTESKSIRPRERLRSANRRIRPPRLRINDTIVLNQCLVEPVGPREDACLRQLKIRVAGLDGTRPVDQDQG